METFFSFVLASVVTLYFVRRYLKSMAASHSRAPAEARRTSPKAEPAKLPCPRCGALLVKGASFCSQCGAALSLWTIQQAAVQIGGQEPKGKPKPVINAALCIGCGSCVDVCPEDGTLALVNGKALLVNPSSCVGHARCADVCPTQSIKLSYGGVLQTIKVPDIKENFETNIPGLFIIGEMGGLGLIKTAINEGRFVIDYLRIRLGARNPAGTAHARAAAGSGSAGHTVPTVAPAEEPYDVAIVGAGPAGLSASLTAHQHGLRYLTLEQGAIAATIKQYPRHKFLMAEPLEMPLYGNLYIADGTKEALLSVWETIIDNTGVRIHTDEKVESLRANGEGFVVETGSSRYNARSVILAMGRRGTPRRLGIPGEELSKVAYNLIEADSYSNRDVLVVGGGDSAVEASLALSKAGKNRVILAHRGGSLTRIRDRNREQLDQASSSGRVRVLLDSQVAAIDKDTVQMRCPEGLLTLKNDYVFVLIGGESPENFLRKVGVNIVEKALRA